jgi:hypothetical protein
MYWAIESPISSGYPRNQGDRDYLSPVVLSLKSRSSRKVDDFLKWLGIGFMVLVGLMLFVWIIAFDRGLNQLLSLGAIGELLHANGDTHIQSFPPPCELQDRVAEILVGFPHFVSTSIGLKFPAMPNSLIQYPRIHTYDHGGIIPCI